MRGKDLLNDISNVDDELLAEAEASMTVIRKEIVGINGLQWLHVLLLLHR